MRPDRVAARPADTGRPPSRTGPVPGRLARPRPVGGARRVRVPAGMFDGTVTPVWSWGRCPPGLPQVGRARYRRPPIRCRGCYPVTDRRLSDRGPGRWGADVEGDRCDGSEEGGSTPRPKKPAPAAKKTGRRPPRRARRPSHAAKKAAPKKAARRQEGDSRAKTGRPGHQAKKAAPAEEGRRQKRPSRPRRRRRRPAAKKAAPKKADRRPRRRRPRCQEGAALRPRPKRPTVGPYAKETKFLEEQRALLLEERAIYSGQAVDLRAEADSLALEREPGDVQFDEESGEGGTVTVDRERNLALSAQASAAVEEIDDALRKIDRKTYGGCERCYQPIPKARLRALPFARLCVACKSGGLSRR